MARTLIRTLGSIVVLMLCGSELAGAADQAYTTEIQKWRQDFDADVRTGGWLTLVGRNKLRGSAWTLGSDPRSQVRLPAKAPAHLGTLRRRAQGFELEPAEGAAMTVDDQPVTHTVELATKSPRGRIRVQDLEMHVRFVGEDPYLFVVDPHNAAITAFKGSTWYPIDPAFRIAARFEPYTHERLEQVPLTHVDSKESFPSTGDVAFSIGGERLRLKTYIDDGQLFVMFLDPTNGRETYGGGRFLHAPLPKDGQTILDFNKAFNPYCSLNSNVMCPIPPPGNRLSHDVRAGEMFSGQE